MPKRAPAPPDALIQEIQANNVVPFIGAGFSMSAHSEGSNDPVMPNYRQLLKRLLEHAILSGGIKISVKAMLDEGRDDLAADLLRREMGDYPFYEQIRLILEPADQKIQGSFGHKLLSMMNFRRLITTNYDRLLERFVAPNYEVFTASDLATFRLFRFDKQRGHIIKLHGDITRPNTIPFGNAALYAHYGFDHLGKPLANISNESKELQTFLEQLFNENTVLFLGSSLAATEEYIKLLLELVKSWGGSLRKRHYALVAYDEKYEKLREHFSRGANIEYLTYEPNEDGTHSQLWEFISFLNVGRTQEKFQSGRKWNQWYRAEERVAYLQFQLEREQTATSIRYLTPSLTNAISTHHHLDVMCRKELSIKFGNDPIYVNQILASMALRSDNLNKRLYEDNLEIRILFLESELRKSLDPKVQKNRDDFNVVIERYQYLLNLIEETDMEVRVIPKLSNADLKSLHEASYALIFNQSSDETVADVTIAYASQATINYFEIHMIHINSTEVRDRTYQYERFWAAALNEKRTVLLIQELLERAMEGLNDIPET
jgi:hypothetical protein